MTTYFRFRLTVNARPARKTRRCQAGGGLLLCSIADCALERHIADEAACKGQLAELGSSLSGPEPETTDPYGLHFLPP